MSTSGKAAGGPPTGPAGGDIAGTGASTYPNPTLTALGAATGPIGSALLTPVVTIDTKGRVTALTSTAAGGAGILAASATLNAAAILTLFSAPTTLIAAPGANLAVDIVSCFVEFKAGNVGYFPATTVACYYSAPAVTSRFATVAFFSILSDLPVASRVVRVSAPLAGTAANVPSTAGVNAAIVVGASTANPVAFGPIVTKAVADGGLGYAVGDTGTIGPDPSTFDESATYIVTATNGAPGAVTAFTVIAAGAAYIPANSPIPTVNGGAQPGAGVGFTVTVATIPAADGTLYVSALYRTVTTH